MTGGRGNHDTRAATLALLETLIGFDTVSDKSNLGLVERIEAYLRDEDIAFTRVPNADGDKAAIFATVGPKVDGGILLSGHTDTVPVKGQSWTSDPFALRQQDGKLYGRGSCDMKGFDAICLAMLPVFREACRSRSTSCCPTTRRSAVSARSIRSLASASTCRSPPSPSSASRPR